MPGFTGTAFGAPVRFSGTGAGETEWTVCVGVVVVLKLSIVPARLATSVNKNPEETDAWRLHLSSSPVQTHKGLRGWSRGS